MKMNLDTRTCAERVEVAKRETQMLFGHLNHALELKRMMNVRNKHLAHSLELSRREKKHGPVSPMRYGDESWVLEQTVPIVQKFHCPIKRTNYAFDPSHNAFRNQAEDLWRGTMINVMR